MLATTSLLGSDAPSGALYRFVPSIRWVRALRRASHRLLSEAPIGAGISPTGVHPSVRGGHDILTIQELLGNADEEHERCRRLTLPDAIGALDFHW